MRKAMLVLAVFGLVCSLWAADPSIGTWKLNIAKSKLVPCAQGLPKEETIVIRELGKDEFELTLTGIEGNGAKTSFKITWPQRGGVATDSNATKGDSSVVTMIGPGEWYDTAMQNGKQNQFVHSSISKDGKTMNVRVKATDAQGKTTEQLAIYEKQ